MPETKEETKTDISFISDFQSNGFRERLITRDIASSFSVKSVKDEGGEITHHYYPYTRKGEIVAYKERVVEGKKFRTVGDFKEVELFGQSLFPGGGRRLVITEGELDCLAVAQANFQHYQKLQPVVSVPTGAQSAAKAAIAHREWLRSFEEVILFMDQDEPGQAGQNELARIIGPDKVKIAKSKYKDPCDALVADGYKGIMRPLWDAQSWCPAGIVNSKDTWDTYRAEKDAVYTPWPKFIDGLNDKIYGRRLGSITVFTSGTGSGKTSFLREDMFELARTTDSNIGVCSLEESIAESVRGFISLELNKRVGIPGVKTTEEEERGAWERTMGTGRYEILDHQGSVSDDTLLEKLEYMACVCDYIYLDHITIAISEVDGSTNEAMDKFMSELLKMAKRHNVWFGVVSHLRKSKQDQTSFEQGAEINEDSLKGSGSLKQIAAQIIALERNKNDDDASVRNKVKVRVLKDRFGGDTGTAGEYRFSFEDGRLHPVKTEDSAVLDGFEPIEES